MKIEGRNAVTEALKSDGIDYLYAEKGAKHPILRLAEEKGVRVKFVDKPVLDRESQTGHHQGFIGITKDFEYCEEEDILRCAEQRGEPPFILILDGIEDPHNLGSIIRSAECAGVHGLIIPRNRAVGVNETVIRCSAGATVNMNIARVTNINTTIEWLKKKGVWVFAADMDGQSVYSADLSGSIALVIGSEGFGVKKLTKELCDGVVSLPVRGKINSLNASVACAVLTYEVLRGRLMQK